MSEVNLWISAIQCSGRVVVLEETTSTQDAAIENNLQVGDVCAALNQTASRGRRGAKWNASGGVSVTVVLKLAGPELSIALAAVLADNLEACIDNTIGIKWPNDLFVEGKKLAGILIEQRAGIYLVGVGVNVEPIDQPNSVGIHELGCHIDRATIAGLVVSSIFSACDLDSESAISLWQTRDILVGTIQTIQSESNTVHGMVLSIDPCHNLILQTESGIFELPAATSTILSPC
ncbi:biotin--[acetyl-CoA-carboxylase] ligase [PVC group bacterium]|nr:biotin--[acetyl-CoA-carboxylase] ligase [PVC group bacterium]